MNYIKELNAFKNWLLLNELPTSAIVLWHTLMTINNATNWKREFNAPNSVVRKLSGLSKQGLLNARGHLIDHERIHCQKGKRGQAPIYEMVPFGRDVAPFMSSSTSQRSTRTGNDTTSNDPARAPEASSSKSTSCQDAGMNEIPDADGVPRANATSGSRSDAESSGVSGSDSNDTARCTAHVRSDDGDHHTSASHLLTGRFSGTSARDSAGAVNDTSASHLEDPSLDESTPLLVDSSSDQSDTESWPIHKQKQTKKQESSRMREACDPVSLYETNIGKLRPITADLLKAWCIERGEALVTAAIELAVKRGGRTFRYVETILKDWASKDIMTLDEMQAFEQEKSSRTSNAASFRGWRDEEEKAVFFEALRREGALS